MLEENPIKKQLADSQLLIILLLLFIGFKFLPRLWPGDPGGFLAEAATVGPEILVQLDSISAGFDFEEQPALYMISSKACHYCDLARRDIKKAGWKMYEIYVESGSEAVSVYHKIVKLSGSPGTPQIIAGEKLFVGYDRAQVQSVPGFNS